MRQDGSINCRKKIQVTKMPQTRVRLYQSLRSAHLERARVLTPATIVYGEKRYDFDASLTERLHLVPGHGMRAAQWLWQHPPSILEVNEPLMLESAIWTAGAIACLRVRRLFGGPPVRLVTYAIENLDPFLRPVRPQWKPRLRRMLERLCVRFIWRSLTRIAFGTQAAEQLYQQVLGPSKAQSALIWALPAAAHDNGHKTANQAVFVSAFQERKGVSQLMAAWPLVVAQLPRATLLMIGKGPMLDTVSSAAKWDSTIEVLVDPPRTEIASRLAAATVLVLPSQATQAWREQVGLPIVEGLAHACTVVTTDQTGLADWLVEQGHHVVPTPYEPADLARALIAALRDPLDLEIVRRSLPLRDGRLAADDWMCDVDVH